MEMKHLLRLYRGEGHVRDAGQFCGEAAQSTGESRDC